MKLALNVGKVRHRARALVDVELECGCVLNYMFEFEPGRTPSSRKNAISVRSMIDKRVKGWWVPTETNPGEIIENCGAGDDCILACMGALAYNKAWDDIRRQGLHAAQHYIRENILPEGQLKGLESRKRKVR